MKTTQLFALALFSFGPWAAQGQSTATSPLDMVVPAGATYVVDENFATPVLNSLRLENGSKLVITNSLESFSLVVDSLFIGENVTIDARGKSSPAAPAVNPPSQSRQKSAGRNGKEGKQGNNGNKGGQGVNVEISANVLHLVSFHIITSGGAGGAGGPGQNGGKGGNADCPSNHGGLGGNGGTGGDGGDGGCPGTVDFTFNQMQVFTNSAGAFVSDFIRWTADGGKGGAAGPGGKGGKGGNSGDCGFWDVSGGNGGSKGANGSKGKDCPSLDTNTPWFRYNGGPGTWGR